MVSTYFEPIYARKAFPCLDEPSYKSVFKLKINTFSDYTVISNNSLVKKEEFDECYSYTFAETPLMSTYLLHWTLCRLEPTSERASDGTLISLYGDCSAEYLAIAVESFEYFLQYFDIGYPLPKLDIIGVYSDS